MKREHSRLRAIMLLLVCVCLTGSVSHATGSTGEQLETTGENIDRLEDQQEDQQRELNDLEQYQGNLSTELSSLNTGLQQVSGDMTELQTRIEEMNGRIAETEQQLAELQEQSEAQYNAMVLRIQYIYENGDTSYLDALLGAESFADLLNRAAYVQEIHNYDRAQLELYQETISEIARQQSQLENDREELLTAQRELEEKKGEIDTLISQYQSQLQAANDQIASAQDALAATEAELEQQRAYEEELERRKAQEDAARLEEIRQQETELPQGGGSVDPVEATDSDLAMLAAIIQCEAGGESYEGKLAVGSVVMNRVASSYFPDSIAGVLYQQNQFSPVASGRFAQVLAQGADAECVQAAQDVLNGTRTLNCLYFRRNNGLIEGTVIGNHVFY